MGPLLRRPFWAALALACGWSIVQVPAGEPSCRAPHRVFRCDATPPPVCRSIVRPCPPDADHPSDPPVEPMPEPPVEPMPEPPEVPEIPEAMNFPQAPPSLNNLPQLASSSLSTAPGMIGDFFGTGASSSNTGQIIGQAVFPEDTFLGGGFRYLDGVSISEGFGTAIGVTSDRDTYTIAPLPPGVIGNGSGTDAVLTGLVETNFAVTTIVDSGPFQATRTDEVVNTNIPGTVPGSYNVYNISRGVGIVIPNPGSSGAAVGRQKVTENTSPMPRDRVYVNYSYFANTPLAAGGVDVNRLTPGFEKTFFDGTSSIEVRFPFASTLDSDITQGGLTGTDKTEFGNITAYFKTILLGGGRRDNYAITGGLGMTLPTADDVRVFNTAGRELIAVDNEAVHLLPFVGGLYAPNDRWYAQGFLQFDFDTNGNPVFADTDSTSLRRIGRADDPAYVFVDVGVGYWLHRSRNRSSFIQGISPSLELHYNRSLAETDVVQSGLFQVGTKQDNIELLNGVFGTTVNCRNNLAFTAGYAFPIGSGLDQQFDGEFRLFANWFFGPNGNPLRRVPGL